MILAYREDRQALLWSGLVCFGILLAAAVMYYANVLWHLLPLAQKASFVACACWLLALHLAPRARGR